MTVMLVCLVGRHEATSSSPSFLIHGGFECFGQRADPFVNTLGSLNAVAQANHVAALLHAFKMLRGEGHEEDGRRSVRRGD